VQVFGPAALAVSPRIGHIHVTVDDAPWRWADASGEPLNINGLPAGPDKVLIELVNANHQTLDRGVVNFVIPCWLLAAGPPPGVEGLDQGPARKGRAGGAQCTGLLRVSEARLSATTRWHLA
jgi:hypothetical protein